MNWRRPGTTVSRALWTAAERNRLPGGGASSPSWLSKSARCLGICFTIIAPVQRASRYAPRFRMRSSRPNVDLISPGGGIGRLLQGGKGCLASRQRRDLEVRDNEEIEFGWSCMCAPVRGERPDKHAGRVPLDASKDADRATRMRRRFVVFF